ncbi:MAG: hypothetical protein ACI84R_002914, partial [Candidatus Azotimanducaceae bacterium]
PVMFGTSYGFDFGQFVSQIKHRSLLSRRSSLVLGQGGQRGKRIWGVQKAVGCTIGFCLE